MPTAPEAILVQALALAPEDRAKLASGLLASLNDDRADEAGVERLWSEETQRRAAQLPSREVGLTTWEHLAERVDEMRPPSPAE
jgi:hypothetical protein